MQYQQEHFGNWVFDLLNNPVFGIETLTVYTGCINLFVLKCVLRFIFRYTYIVLLIAFASVVASNVLSGLGGRVVYPITNTA